MLYLIILEPLVVQLQNPQVLEVTGTDVQSITKEFLTYDNFVFETLNDNQVIASISTYHDLEVWKYR